MSPITLKSAREVLLKEFGFSDFRGDQWPAIEAILAGRSTLLLMPTGMGKSLCYQLPAKLRPGLVLVISPLIALMQDQVDAAKKRGFRAAFINSSLSSQSRNEHYKRLQAGEFEIIYVTPERFRKPEFWQALTGQNIQLLAVDEAHCISAWGHDFRPDYSRIGEIRERLGNPVTLALTATATPKVQEDILKQLGLHKKTEEPSIATTTISTTATTAASSTEALVLDHGLERPNLATEVFHVHGLAQKIQAFMALRHQTPGAAIVYFALIQSLHAFSHELHRLSIPHLVYHGSRNDRERRDVLRQFISDDAPLVLATPAFGLGVDKENVRLVMHAETPGSLEAYYQEIGRAGRDSKPARAALFYDPDDMAIQMDFVKWANPDPGFVQAVYNLIDRNLARVHAEGLDYLRKQMNFFNTRDFRLETAVNWLERWGCIEGEKDPRTWRTVEPPPPELLSESRHKEHLKATNEKLLEMIRFAELEEGCRMQRIYQYFGRRESNTCGVCDLCLKKASSPS